MQDLIAITEKTIGEDLIQTVNARELHAALGVKERFNDWIRRYVVKFVENQDYVTFTVQPVKGRPSVEYALSLDIQ